MSWFGTNKKNEEEESVEEDDEDEEEEDSENTYNMDLECKNCLSNFDCDIPKGTKVVDYLKDKICEDCGCFIIDGKTK